MPEYLAPGVYVEEVSFRAKSIEGVSTTTTGFVGPTRYGPTDMPLEVITSLGEFEYIYGDGQQLQYVDLNSGGTEAQHNFLWHGARAFFTEGGKRLYVSRIFRKLDDKLLDTALISDRYNDGHARAVFPKGASADNQITIQARFPGVAGNIRLRVIVRISQNILSNEISPTSPVVINTTLGALLPRDVLLVQDLAATGSPPPAINAVFVAERDPSQSPPWRFGNDEPVIFDSPPTTLVPTSLRVAEKDSVKVVTLSLVAVAADGSEQLIGSDLPLDPSHLRGSSPDSLFARFDTDPGSAAQARSLPVIITKGKAITTGIDVLRALILHQPELQKTLLDPNGSDLDRTVEIELKGGHDGLRPGAGEFEGAAPLDKITKTGLKALEDLEDISIVAAPGSTYNLEDPTYRSDARSIIGLLMTHAQTMRYRIAVLDSGNNQSIAQVRALRATLDSKYAAIYYPWVKVLDPITRQEINLPPSGFVAGIYARNDITRAVYKAPANEVVNLALGFEQLLNKAQQDVLNPEGINCFRFFEGRGFRLWGARTISSDPEWKYVNLRRYFAYLERSIDKGTQWAVFEPNGEQLWANVRRTIEDFLLNEWQSGALLGDKPEKSFFVRCDRSTMTQNDLDNGRLICLIGVAALRPAEFVIFRIGQWTGDRRG
jgi:phage tail sheath protein FI